ncbi:MAG: hypothetical protein HYS12_27855 [Planctomycetes bacterium]|nr:hypothetical protein [Planctomycetota bacterium]
MRWFPLLSLLVLGAGPPAPAQDFTPPPPITPTAEQQRDLAARADKLEGALTALGRQGVRDPAFADIEIYRKAAEWIRRHHEFYQKEAVDWTREALDRGLLRASQAAMGEAPWMTAAGYAVVRGYRSRVDGSVQPYAILFPREYGREAGKHWRLDVVLHGRNTRLTEVSFLHQFNGDQPAPEDLNHVQLHIYGRGNNAYRWAGETDVYEAMRDFLARNEALLIDPSKVVLRGFSMGGAGTWHLGLHNPGRWCVLGPGAGFTSTHGYVKDLPAKLPDYQEACLPIYDAVDWAENLFNVPVVAYSGADDPQRQAVVTIEDKLKKLDLKGVTFPLTHLVAPKRKHEFPAEWQAKAQAAYAKYAAAGREEYPKRVRFVTYTLKYSSCDWVEVIGLDAHYRKALVDAEKTEAGFKVTTTNVRALHLLLPRGSNRAPVTIAIDKEKLETRPYLDPSGAVHVYLERRGEQWRAALPQKLLTDRLRTRQKVTGFQGPIDDAFISSFLCVRGTGKAWHPATQEFAEKNLKRFAAEWDKYLRGHLPVKNDDEVTPQDLATYHLILFGDPGSNTHLAQVLDGLPLQWTRESITLAGRKVDAATHVPVMIYPSPLSSDRYVVLNSGHTFRAADFQGTNALLYPRLGDYALLKLAPTKKDELGVDVVLAGLFDDFWRAAAK